MKKIFFLFLLTSCSVPNLNVDSNFKALNFSDDLSFNEINKLLIEYVKITPYPNIN